MPETRGYPIQRISPIDLSGLAIEYAGAPMQVAAILILDRPVEFDAVQSALTGLVVVSPRFR